MQNTNSKTTIDNFIDSVKAEFEANLKRLVDIPGISADPAHKDDINETASVAADLLRKFGAEADIIPSKGNPVVVGHFKAKTKAPTLTIYNHLDVQPAESADWKTSPFSLSIDGDFYRGRGATDDKGPALTALYAAKYIYEQGIPLNIKFIWELEEEIGSPNFASFLLANKDRLVTDSILVSDTIWLSKDKPSMSYGLRGMVCALVKLSTGNKDVHSGTTGGLARNPIGELSQLLGECYDAKSGNVKIPGFYKDVLPVTKQESENIQQAAFSLEQFKSAYELHSLRTNDAQEGLERIWLKPTFEVHGITGGYNGPGVKTIVPHQAEAKVSMRLVPRQNPLEIFQLFKEFVKIKCPDAEVISEGYLGPYLGSHNDKHHQFAKAAIKSTFGVEPVFTREGGSIGAVVSMHEILQAPIVFLGLSLPEHGYHAINEYFDWQQAKGGMKLFVDYCQRLAQL